MLNEIATKRIQKEIMDLDRDPPPGITCYPKDDTITDLEAWPPDSPYEAGLFKLSIQIPDRYPFQPPQIKFVTSIYHPNIDDTGRICADILKMGEKGEWKPAINLSTALTSLRQLLAAPNPDDPLNADIAREYQLDHPSFLKNAQEYTLKYASEDAISNQL
ncbi:ubiquitin-conjugating enzyme/RWD-like protein [Thamnidium elegans]|nr:ubiquitin-conjugating enzyme/RWD-like protein [Thamnidium elegans]